MSSKALAQLSTNRAPSAVRSVARVSQAEKPAGAAATKLQPAESFRPVAPVGAWTDPARPAGSNYSAEEWTAARLEIDHVVGEASSECEFHVFEIRSGTDGALVRIPKAPAISTQTMAIDGKIVRPGSRVPSEPQPGGSSRPKFLDPTVGLLLDGCLLLGPKAATTYPEAITGNIDLTLTGKQSWARDELPIQQPYRIVRPLEQRETLGWLETVKGSLSFDARGFESNEPEPTKPPIKPISTKSVTVIDSDSVPMPSVHDPNSVAQAEIVDDQDLFSDLFNERPRG